MTAQEAREAAEKNAKDIRRKRILAFEVLLSQEINHAVGNGKFSVEVVDQHDAMTAIQLQMLKDRGYKVEHKRLSHTSYEIEISW